MKIQKTSRCRVYSPKYAELNVFTFLFCQGRQRNRKRFIHVAFFLLRLLFSGILVALVGKLSKVLLFLLVQFIHSLMVKTIWWAMHVTIITTRE